MRSTPVPARPFLATLLVVLAVSVPVAAEECVPTTSTTGLTMQVVGPVPLLDLYLANDVCQPGCVFSTWFYAETNDIPGLQRDDEVHDDTCGGAIEGDVLVT